MTFQHWVALLFGLGALQYVGLSIAYYFGLRPGMAVALVGYAVANLGLIWDIFHSVPKP